VVTGTDVSALKPDPEVYVKALAQLGVDAAEAVAVEDSVNGLVAARRAGLRCVVSPSLYTRHQIFEGAALVVPQLDQWRMEEGDRSLIGG
jgi:beta-phosphoglucomutase-like phosphatase (HAD superfamily)